MAGLNLRIAGTAVLVGTGFGLALGKLLGPKDPFVYIISVYMTLLTGAAILYVIERVAEKKYKNWGA